LNLIRDLIRIAQYVENGIIYLGAITVEEPDGHIVVSCPDVDANLTRLLREVAGDQSVRITHPEPFEGGGIAEKIVDVKIGDELFWVTLHHEMRMLGYNLEE